ncbi:hypothetical protein Acr_16g0000120 [Actinidia rufa]|uniref:Uncharacterized protein n=1 Tax=Actinidia rufa TaxID=165716 RepID=A0A7J0FZN7_9ERIC|nr:hypothetical protein Acr_16g0000120 [Actinidia rufa]
MSKILLLPSDIVSWLTTVAFALTTAFFLLERSWQPGQCPDIGQTLGGCQLSGGRRQPHPDLHLVNTSSQFQIPHQSTIKGSHGSVSAYLHASIYQLCPYCAPCSDAEEELALSASNLLHLREEFEDLSNNEEKVEEVDEIEYPFVKGGGVNSDSTTEMALKQKVTINDTAMEHDTCLALAQVVMLLNDMANLAAEEEKVDANLLVMQHVQGIEESPNYGGRVEEHNRCLAAEVKRREDSDKKDAKALLESATTPELEIPDFPEPYSPILLLVFNEEFANQPTEDEAKDDEEVGDFVTANKLKKEAGTSEPGDGNQDIPPKV